MKINNQSRHDNLPQQNYYKVSSSGSEERNQNKVRLHNYAYTRGKDTAGCFVKIEASDTS